MHSILTRYSDLPGDRDLVFRSLCSLLAENPEWIEWRKFGGQEWEFLGKMAVAALLNALLFKQLDRILTSFNEREIPVVLLKGADLAIVLSSPA